MLGELHAAVAGPPIGEEGVITAELDLASVRRAKQQFDVVGHYARADIFRLDVRPNVPGPVRQSPTVAVDDLSPEPGSVVVDE